ncbi:hypothetical protein ACQVP2_06505 [Methylobacterium aquaticum]|uniref:hypothetical protein n=1 Tax=Methylobacterium aquaticum TaxID=270351 RepID=UPI003D1720B0
MTALPSKTGTRSVAGAALLAALAAALLTGAALTGPAWAQGYGVVIGDEDDAILPPRAVIFRLGRAGFTGMTAPRFDGETYRVQADSPWGNRVQLVVDARTGRILDRERVEAPLIPPGSVPGGRRPGYGWTEAEARPPWPRDDAFRERSLRDNGWRDRETYAPVPLSRGEPLPPVIRRPDERRVAARPLPQQSLPSEVPPAEAPAPRATGANPMGLNPDSPAARSGAAPRRETAPEGTTEPPRKIAARPKPAEKTETPSALVPPLAPAPQAAPAAKPDPAPAKPAEAASKPAEVKPAEVKQAEAKPAEAKAGGWKTPPEGNRPVRVIGGITQVPGRDEPAKE